MNTNEKGNIGLAKAISDFTTNKYSVFLPFTDTTCIDLIVANAIMVTRRLQVKYREVKNGIVTVPFQNVVNGKRVDVDLSKIDGWCVYCPGMDRVYYLNKNDVGANRTFSFRVKPPKKNQWKTAPDGSRFVAAERLWE